MAAVGAMPIHVGQEKESCAQTDNALDSGWHKMAQASSFALQAPLGSDLNKHEQVEQFH